LSPPGHAASYYLATADAMPAQPQLEGRLRADVAIIGGGYTGLSTLLHLAERGYDAVLLEAAEIGAGASGRNGGQLSSGQRVAQPALQRLVGDERARLLWQLAEDAKALVKERIARHAIPCDLKPGILDAAHKPAHAVDLQREAEFLHTRYGYPHARYVPRAEMAAMLGTSRYSGGLLDRDGGHLHPLNYARGLARAALEAGGRIFEQSRVVRIDDGREPVAVTRRGEIRARHLVLAMNGYLGRLVPGIAGRIMPLNSFMLATAPLGEAGARALIRDDVAVADTKHVVDYFRLSADHRLLFGGGETYTRRVPADLKGFVRRHMLRVFPQLDNVPIDYAWGGTLAITRTRLPHFARLAPNVFVAHGYSGQGLALATLAGQLIADAIAGMAERFDVMASLPVPSFPGGTLLRLPTLVLGTVYYSLRDRL
jgi:gamma-glutamylputrescine oxidase